MTAIWNRNRGFTLLEVMIAMTLVAIVFVPLLSLRNQNISETYYARKLLRAEFLSNEKLSGLQIYQIPTLGETKGDFGEKFPDFRWEQTVTETPLGPVNEVHLKLFWLRGEKEEEIEWVQYIRNSSG
ncbi:MAG: prepilin-type N-terminal cleavage/methylation domain-containing protein [Nitrospiria bacterium]